MALAVVIFLLVIGSIIFHFASPWWFTERAADWGSIDFTINVTFWVTGFVFIAVNLFLAYCVYKFRQKPGHKAVYEPENHKLEVSLSECSYYKHPFFFRQLYTEHLPIAIITSRRLLQIS